MICYNTCCLWEAITLEREFTVSFFFSSDPDPRTWRRRRKEVISRVTERGGEMGGWGGREKHCFFLTKIEKSWKLWPGERKGNDQNGRIFRARKSQRIGNFDFELQLNIINRKQAKCTTGQGRIIKLKTSLIGGIRAARAMYKNFSEWGKDRDKNKA